MGTNGISRNVSADTITNDDDDNNNIATAATVNATATPAVTAYRGVLQALFVSLIHKFLLFNGIRIVIISKPPTANPCTQPNETRFQPSDLILPR